MENISDSSKRGVVKKLVQSHEGPAKALEVARSIQDGWFRCQALTTVAEAMIDDGQRRSILREAFAAAAGLPEVNRRVTVASWPLEALVRAGDRELVRLHTAALLEDLAGEPSPVRRGDAFSHLLGALFHAPADDFGSVLELARQAWAEPLLGGKKNKRGESSLARWAPFIAERDPETAEAMIDEITSPIKKAEAIARLNELADEKTDFERS